MRSSFAGLVVVLVLISSVSLGLIAPIANPYRTTYLSGVQSNLAYKFFQYPLPSGSAEPWAITTDKAGMVWFAEQGTNRIGELNPSTGNISEYSIPTPNSTVNSVTVDTQGNVWFTELTGNNIGELQNGSKSITEYHVPGWAYQILGQTQYQSCGPSEVVPDSSGHIWVNCIFSNQIDEFFPATMKFFSFDLPVFQSAPAGLVFDHQGNFWFTAADVDMVGHGIVSELQNGTSNGLTEFAPINQTYFFTFEHPLGFQGPYENSSSSLPTPSGIAISPDGNTLWITEHVDSSFDSYNIQTQSLVRYWTSRTNDAFGYSVSFPNGIAIDQSGNVWISEHYGNKIAEFNPSTESLIEYIVPCCDSYSAGTYTLTLGKNGTVWFVEIAGNAIGELAPVTANQTYSLNLGASVLNTGTSGSASIPVTITGATSQSVSFDVSGITGTGILSNSSASFTPGSVKISAYGNATSELTINTLGLSTGTYYLTVSAKILPQGVIYSRILKLVVSNYSSLLTSAIIVGVVASVLVVGTIAVLLKRRRGGGMMSRKRRARYGRITKRFPRRALVP